MSRCSMPAPAAFVLFVAVVTAALPGAAQPAQPPAAPAAVDRVGAVLQVLADEGRARRLGAAAAHGTIAAGLIGVGVTYIIVGNADPLLSKQEYQDTMNAGLVMTGLAAVPAILGGVALFTESAEEERDALSRSGKRGDALRSLEHDAADRGVLPLVIGGASLVGGVGAAVAGGYFLAFPHIVGIESSPIAHGTGAELIGLGVASLGVGTIAMFASSGASRQLELVRAAGE